jgi:hypothetical protein
MRTKLVIDRDDKIFRRVKAKQEAARKADNASPVTINRWDMSLVPSIFVGMQDWHPALPGSLKKTANIESNARRPKRSLVRKPRAFLTISREYRRGCAREADVFVFFSSMMTGIEESDEAGVVWWTGTFSFMGWMFRLFRK